MKYKTNYSEATINIGEFLFVMTCSACPEQYDVYICNDTKVNKESPKIGYVRLRHGAFRVDYKQCGEETIFEADTAGDGSFYDQTERRTYLKKAAKAIRDKINDRTIKVKI